MDRKKYLIFVVVGFFSGIIFFFSPLIFSRFSFAFDDFASYIFYILNKKEARAEQVILVSIDHNSFHKLNQSWPLRRSLYAKAINVLTKNKAKVIGFDLVFKGEGEPAEDNELIGALKDFSGKVVLGYYFLDEESGYGYPKKEFQEHSSIGFINATKDSDGVIRRLNSLRLKDSPDFSLAIKIASSFYETSPQASRDIIFIKDKKIPINKDGTINVNYLLRPKDVRTISLYDLLTENFPEKLFQGKIVLFGPTLAIAQDIHPTPLGNMPGVFIHVNIIADVLKGKFIKNLPVIIPVCAMVLALIIIGYILINVTFLRGFFLYLGVVLLFFWLDIILKFLGWQFPYGQLVISSASFFIIGNLYNYVGFIALILKVKNKMIIDPLTNLFNLRYFSERLVLELKSFPLKKRHLIVIILEGFKFSLKEKSFEELKSTWERITSCLFSSSNLWSRCSDEVVVGVLRNKEDAKTIKAGLEEILFEKQIKIKIKLGILELEPNTDLRHILHFLIESLGKSHEETVFFIKDQLPLQTYGKMKPDSSLSSLYLDAEEKNIELLRFVKELKEAEKKTEEAYFQLISSLIAALESKDPYTKGHSQRVCDYAFMLAVNLNLSEEEKEVIRKAALLHDLGKIGIPDSILHKKGKLTEEEFSVIKEHEIFSAKILEPIKEFKDVIPSILHHHENFDGSGYPHGLAADFIPLGARIIAISDIFDALTTGRDYKYAMSIAEAVKELNNIKGKKLDPHLVDSFIEALKELNLFHP